MTESFQNVFVHKSSYVDEEVEVGNGTKIWHFSHVMPEATIGDNCTIGQNVFIDRNVSIGNDVKIQNNVSVYQGVTLEDGVFCGPSMVFTNVNRPRSFFPKDDSEYQKTNVGRGATIGANATIVCGNDLGKWCFVGAGTVVTEEVQNYEIVVGNPARQVGYVCKCGHSLNEGTQLNQFTCGHCQRQYRPIRNTIELIQD